MVGKTGETGEVRLGSVTGRHLGVVQDLQLQEPDIKNAIAPVSLDHADVTACRAAPGEGTIHLDNRIAGDWKFVQIFELLAQEIKPTSRNCNKGGNIIGQIKNTQANVEAFVINPKSWDTNTIGNC